MQMGWQVVVQGKVNALHRAGKQSIDPLAPFGNPVGAENAPELVRYPCDAAQGLFVEVIEPHQSPGEGGFDSGHGPRIGAAEVHELNSQLGPDHVVMVERH